ncbi:hypothetical protein ACZ81_01410 [Alteromonas macleodii]|nr:hypothetical protein ACZ81_01410 [Alteromonas macleodii]
MRFLGAVKAKKRFFNKKLMHVLAYFSKWVLRLLHMLKTQRNITLLLFKRGNAPLLCVLKR